ERHAIVVLAAGIILERGSPEPGDSLAVIHLAQTPEAIGVTQRQLRVGVPLLRGEIEQPYTVDRVMQSFATGELECAQPVLRCRVTVGGIADQRGLGRVAGTIELGGAPLGYRKPAGRSLREGGYSTQKQGQGRSRADGLQGHVVPSVGDGEENAISFPA